MGLLAKMIERTEELDDVKNNVWEKKEDLQIPPPRLLGPKFCTFEHMPSEINREAPHAQAASAMQRYTKYSKGYVKNDTPRNINFNEKLTLQYEKDPRVFWSNSKHVVILPKSLVEFAHNVHSIRSSPAFSEREFSRMGWMISPRRASITAANADKRLSLSNLLPMKRKLEKAMDAGNFKKRNLFNNS